MQILDEQVSLKENLRNSLKRHWLLWVLLVLTVFLDYLSTLYFMFLDGVHTEGNTVIRWLAYEFGVVIGVFLGKSLQIFAALCFVSLTQKLARAVLLLLVLLNAVAVINNLL